MTVFFESALITFLKAEMEKKNKTKKNKWVFHAGKKYKKEKMRDRETKLQVAQWRK